MRLGTLCRIIRIILRDILRSSPANRLVDRAVFAAAINQVKNGHDQFGIHVLEPLFQVTEPVEPALVIVVFRTGRAIGVVHLNQPLRIHELPLTIKGRIDGRNRGVDLPETGSPNLDRFGVPDERQPITRIDPCRIGNTPDASGGCRVDVREHALQYARADALKPDLVGRHQGGNQIAERFLNSVTDFVKDAGLIGILQSHHVLQRIHAVGQLEPDAGIGDQIVHPHRQPGTGLIIAVQLQDAVGQILEIRPCQFGRGQKIVIAQNQRHQLSGSIDAAIGRKGGEGTVAHLNGRVEIEGVNLNPVRHVHFGNLFESPHDLRDLGLWIGRVPKLGQAPWLGSKLELLFEIAVPGGAEGHELAGRFTD